MATDTTRYSVIDKNGTELSIALTPADFEKSTYKDEGASLGFSVEGDNHPYSDAAVKAVEKGRAATAARAQAQGMPTIYGPEEPPVSAVIREEKAVAKATEATEAASKPKV